MHVKNQHIKNAAYLNGFPSIVWFIPQVSAGSHIDQLAISLHIHVFNFTCNNLYRQILHTVYDTDESFIDAAIIAFSSNYQLKRYSCISNKFVLFGWVTIFSKGKTWELRAEKKRC